MNDDTLSNRISLVIAKFLFTFGREDYYDDLAEALADDGEPLSVIRKDAKRAEDRKDVMAALFNLWATRMQDRSFVAALGDTVPQIDRMILHSSNTANSLISGLRFLAIAIRASKKMTGSIALALAMPAVLLLAFGGMLAAFAYILVPLLSSMLKPEYWPPIGKLVYSISYFVINYGHWAALSAIALLTAMIMSFSRWTGAVRGWFDNHVPPYMIYRDYSGSLFLVSLAALMSKDVGLAEALATLREHSNRWTSWHIDMIREALMTESQNPARAFDTGIFGQRLTDRVIDFGERSSFPEAISKVGLKSIDKSTAIVTQSAKLLNGILIIFCGVFLMMMFAGAFTTIQKLQTEKRMQIQNSR